MPFDVHDQAVTTTIGCAEEGRSRPAILVRAARRVAGQYRRRRDLPVALPGLAGQSGEALLQLLAAAEARCERARRERLPGYRAARHVTVLGALLAEEAAAAVSTR